MGRVEIAECMKIGRVTKGFSQAEVAEKLNLTFQAISNYERNASRIESDTLVKLCSIYELSPDVVLNSVTWGLWSIYEDFENARDDNMKRYIFESNGCCPKYIYEYQRLFTSTSIDNIPLTTDERFYLESFRSLNVDGQRKVIEYVNDLTASGKYTAGTALREK